jgi:hypothetical protein
MRPNKDNAGLQERDDRKGRGERINPGGKLSHDLSSAKMTSDGHRIAVLISGSGKPITPAVLPLL